MANQPLRRGRRLTRAALDRIFTPLGTRPNDSITPIEGVSPVNVIHLIGNLGADPEIKGGRSNPVATISVATTERFKDAKGERQEKTTWHRVVAFGTLAKLMDEHCFKGQKIAITGRQEHRSYEADGTTKYISEVIANTVEFLTWKERR